MKFAATAFGAALAVFAGLALPLTMVFAHCGKERSATPARTAAIKEQMPWGIAGDTGAVKRTIELAMSDEMRFSPNRIEIKEGETVRFVLKNHGKLLHEFVLGTKDALAAHAAAMAEQPKMQHAHDHGAQVAPGKSGSLVWNFNRPGEFDFACLIEGHYDAGMTGTISVLPR